MNFQDMFWLYVFTRLDSVKTAIVSLLCICVVFAVGFGAAYLEYNWDEHAAQGKKAGWAALLCLTLVVLIPSNSDMAVIVAGSEVLKAAKSEPAQRIAGKAVSVLEKAFDSYLDERDKK